MEENEMKPELLALGIEIQSELISIGMDEVEIMNFWDDCYKKAQSLPKLIQRVNQN